MKLADPTSKSQNNINLLKESEIETKRVQTLIENFYYYIIWQLKKIPKKHLQKNDFIKPQISEIHTGIIYFKN